MNLVIVLCVGWLISFLGQLPLGTTSFTATQITIQEGFKRAWQYAFGVAIVEIIYLRIVLLGINSIINNKVLFSILGWITVVLFLILGIASFVTSRKQGKEQKALLLKNNMNRFALGLTMSALNPVQIPFWLIWSTYCIEHGVLHPIRIEYDLYTIGCGIGTVCGLAFYMYGGNWLVTKMNASNKMLNTIMGVVFIFAALAQLYRMVG